MINERIDVYYDARAYLYRDFGVGGFVNAIFVGESWRYRVLADDMSGQTVALHVGDWTECWDIFRKITWRRR